MSKMCVSNYTRCFIGKLFFMSLANLEIFFQTNNTLAGHCSVGYKKRLPFAGSLFAIAVCLNLRLGGGLDILECLANLVADTTCNVTFHSQNHRADSLC